MGGSDMGSFAETEPFGPLAGSLDGIASLRLSQFKAMTSQNGFTFSRMQEVPTEPWHITHNLYYAVCEAFRMMSENLTAGNKPKDVALIVGANGKLKIENVPTAKTRREALKKYLFGPSYKRNEMIVSANERVAVDEFDLLDKYIAALSNFGRETPPDLGDVIAI